MVSVTAVYRYCREHNYGGFVVGGNFRNSGEMLALARRDQLTIAPALLKELVDN